MHEIIFLVGPRGAGKTTIGKVLATQLGYTFVDTDIYMWEKNGKTVAEVVAEEGWQGFREREQKTLREVTMPYTVIATGGGMVLMKENRQFMRANGLVIYLSVPLAVLVERLSSAPHLVSRPSLTGKPMLEELQEILVERDPLYQAAAQYVVDASQSPDAVALSICQFL